MADDDRRKDDRRDDDRRDDRKDDRKDDRDDDRRDDRDDDRNDDDRNDDDRRDDRGSRRERELASEAAKYRRRLRETEAKLADFERKQQPESERAVAEARDEVRRELEKKHGRELVQLRVQVLAASKLRDPEDAARLLDVDELAELADDPRALQRAVADAVDELIERKPYLARDSRDGEGGDDDRRDSRDRGRDRMQSTMSPGSRSGDRDSNRDRDRGEPDSWLRKAARR